MGTNKTIVFVDIRGFTKSCQRSDLVLSINEFLDRFYSLLDANFPEASKKFLGDGAMIVSDMSDLADILACIEETRRQFAELRQSFSQQVGVEIDMALGFGASRGTVIMLQRQSKEANIIIHDFISPRINLAARLCSLARPSGIVLHKESFPDLPSNVKTKFHITVFKDIPGLETQDIRCWVETGVVSIITSHPIVEALSVEVHVTGLAFRDGKLLLCERGTKREIHPGRWSGPGGKLRANVSFDEALKQVFAREVGVEIASIKLLETYFIEDLRIPGLVFYCQIRDREPYNKDGKNVQIRFFSEEDLGLVADRLSPTIEVITKAFAEDRDCVRVPIRIRTLLSTQCDFSCSYCHHEHVDSEEIGQREKIAATLKELSNKFNLYRITLTGGEPLLPFQSKDLFSVATFIRSTMSFMGPLCVITHGRYLTDTNIEALSRFGVNLKISIFAFDDDAFAAYAGSRWPDYLDDLLCKFRALEENKLFYSLNVVLRKEINDRLPDFVERLNRERLRPGKIKVIEMIRPKDAASGFSESFIEVEKCSLFHGDYVTNVNSDFCHRLRMAYKGQTVEFYRYPCQDPTNCRRCVEKWDMIVRPDGKLQVCRHVCDENPNLLSIFGLLQCGVVWEDYRLRYFERPSY